jgi:predicted murein hydrolase (TIGR00659 family)
MTWFVESPIFGMLLSLVAFEIGLWVNKKTKISFLNPLLLALVLIILVLSVFHISLDDYNNGGQVISFFLGPATVSLAIPLYKNIKLLKTNAIPIMGGICIGTAVGIASIILMAKAFALDISLGLSLVPKSVTTPIGIEVSKQIGGIPEITVAAIIFTGLTGAIVAEGLFKLIKINDPVAIGIAIGTSSHALGTSKALEMGEIEGSMSGLAIGIAGLMTVIIAPLLILLFNYIS